MAITVKEIQEKEFATQKAGGYDMEEVDDFLDALAGQMGDMARDALKNREQLDAIISELDAAKAKQARLAEELNAMKAAPKADTPNDGEYFRNLEKLMRETLIGSQRVAEDTVAKATDEAEKAVANAKAEAEQLLLNARDQANALIADARAEANRLESENNQVKSAIEAYREGFRKLVAEQTAAMDRT